MRLKMLQIVQILNYFKMRANDLDNFYEIKIIKDSEFFTFAHCDDSSVENFCTFLDDFDFVNTINNNFKIKFVITNESFLSEIKRTDIGIAICKNPRYIFFMLHNIFSQSSLKFKSIISKTALISPRAIVPEYNVVIGDNTVISDFVVIYEDVHIGNNCNISSFCTLGNNGFEYKKNDFEVLRVNHFGKVEIGNFVDLKENVSVHKALFTHDSTKIDSYTKIDSNSHISHGVKIGERCLIGSNSNISGNVIIGSNVIVGPSVSIINRLALGENSIISVGSIVTKDVLPNTRVTGNFAIEHKKFINFIKKINE